MATGTIITESLRVGSTLAGHGAVVREIERVAPDNISAGQRAAGIPATWTLLHFAVDDAACGALAEDLAAALDPIGWYADFHSADESFVVFAGRAFSHRRGDSAARAEAEAYARAKGVPEAQIDWP